MHLYYLHNFAAIEFWKFRLLVHTFQICMNLTYGMLLLFVGTNDLTDQMEIRTGHTQYTKVC